MIRSFVKIDGVKYKACVECDGTKCPDPQYVCIVPVRRLKNDR